MLRWVALPVLAISGLACGAEARGGVDDVAAALADPFAPNEELVVLPTRAGVELRFDLVKPASPPSVAVILLAGGDGVLAISEAGIGRAADNFMVRTRQRFADAGAVAAVPDAPSDRPGGLDGFRTTPEHAADLGALVRWLRQRYELPVWMVGTSRGTISAADAASRLGVDGPDGVVLTSSITSGGSERLDDLVLADIAVPVQIVHNARDRCPASPLAGARALPQRLVHARVAPIVVVDGGEQGAGVDPCSALTFHGFYGIEGQVVPDVIGFVHGVEVGATGR